MSRSYPSRLKRILSSLLLAPFLLSATVFAKTNNENVREDGILAIFPAQVPRGFHACLGSTQLGFFIRNVSPGVEVPLPVVEAQVTVTDDQGMTKFLLTDAAGHARFSWPLDHEGMVSFNVTAKKQYYLPAQAYTIKVNVISCQWALRIDFNEEYALIQDSTVLVGATTTWRGSLKAGQATGEDLVSDVSLEGGGGTYHFYAADSIQAPFHFSMDPTVSGDYSIKVKGHSDGRTVELELQTDPVTYPKTVPLKVTDYSNRNIKVNVKAPVATSGGNGLFLELNHLNTVTFPASGGTIQVDSGMSCYFFSPTRTKYSLTITLYPMIGENVSIPDESAVLARLP
jgi:hypothetical protein